jgi:hypothetical protein
MPAFAPDARPLVDALGWGKGLCIEVDIASDVVDEAVVVVEMVTELVLVGKVVDVKVETIPPSVETISPSPFRTIPRFSAQHFGSLSQQKLPSEQVKTRGKKPVPVTVVAL